MLANEIQEKIELSRVKFKGKVEPSVSSEDVKIKCQSYEAKEINNKLYRSKWLFCIEVLDKKVFCKEITPYTEHLNISFTFTVDKKILVKGFKYILYSQHLGTDEIGQKARLVLHEENVPITCSAVIRPGDTCNINDVKIDIKYLDDILDCCKRIHFDYNFGGVV